MRDSDDPGGSQIERAFPGDFIERHLRDIAVEVAHMGVDQLPAIGVLDDRLHVGAIGLDEAAQGFLHERALLLEGSVPEQVAVLVRKRHADVLHHIVNQNIGAVTRTALF